MNTQPTSSNEVRPILEGIIIKHRPAPELYGGVAVETLLGNFAVMPKDQKKAAKLIGHSVKVRKVPREVSYETVEILWEESDATPSSPVSESIEQERARDAAYEYMKDFYSVAVPKSETGRGIVIFMAGAEWAAASQSSEIKELKAWKESALKTMPDFQEIGKLLNLKLGSSVSEQIIPCIKGLKEENERLREEVETWKGQADDWKELAKTGQEIINIHYGNKQ